MEVSRHAVDAMQRRLNDPTIGELDIHKAWSEAKIIIENADFEKRYHEAKGITLEENNGVIVTVKSLNIDTRLELERCCWCGKEIKNNQECQKCCGWVYENKYE